MGTNNAINASSPIQILMGGTNASSMVNVNGVNYFDGTSIATTVVGTSDFVLTSNGSGNAPTFKGIPGITSPLPIIQGGTNATSMTNTDGVVYYDGTSLVTTTVGTSAYVLTSNGSGNAPTFQPTSGGTTFSWNTVVGTSQAVAISNGYIATDTSPTLMYLPSTAALGSEVKFSNLGSGFFIIPAPGQTINFLNQSATYPYYFSTADITAAIDLICVSPNTIWNVINNEGSFAVTVSPLLSPSTVGYYGWYGSVDVMGMMILRNNGTFWFTGVPLANDTTVNTSSPVAMAYGFSFVNIGASGGIAQGALDSNGQAWMWGNNGSGALGNLTTTTVSSPVAVVGNHSFIDIVGITRQASLFLKSDGSVWATGLNDLGQLGDYTKTNRSSPVSVVGNISFIQIASGSQGGYGLDINGNVWAWGNNGAGQLGNLTTTDVSSPVAVVGNHSFVKITGGTRSVAGLKSDGTVWTWGNNSSGELGNLTTTNSSSPISVVGAHSFVDITSYCNSGNGADFRSSFYGLKSTGEVWSWGYNNLGQLGNLTTTNTSSPISVVGNHSFSKIMKQSGSPQMAAIKANSQIWSWGDNVVGQLGDNSATSRSSPVLVVGIP